jgi:hypothetical protein
MPYLKTRLRVLVVAAACAAPLMACGAETRGKAKVGVAPPERIPDVVETTGVPQGAAVTMAELPRELRRVVVADAAKRFGVAESAVVLTRAERVTWNDGSLGCPQPGMGYTQALVPGYRVVARTADQELIYHTDESSGAIACAQALPRTTPRDPSKPPPADDSQPRTDPAAAPAPDR